NDAHRQSKWRPDSSQNGGQTIEGTRELTRETNKRNEQSIIDCAKHGSALGVDLDSDSEFVAALDALEAAAVINPTPVSTNGAKPTPDESGFFYKNQKASPAPVMAVSADNELPEGDFSYTNKKASPAPVTPVDTGYGITEEDVAELLAESRKMYPQFDDDRMW